MYRTLLCLTLLLTSSAFADVVKKSKSGICHTEASSFYEKTKNFTPFDTLEACLDSGGRLPKGMTAQQSQMNRAISEANEQGRAYSRIYDRSEWPHWEDPDNNGCDAIMKKYQLKHTSSELRVLKRMHTACKLPAPYAG